MIRIAFYNNKGGVAKTTTTINTAACLAQLGKKVLLVDMDPQANCSDSAGVFDGAEEANTLYHLMTLPMTRYVEPQFIEMVEATIHSSLPLRCDVLRSNILLDGFQDQVSHSLNREYRLSKVLSVLEGVYDYCLIDCPPTLSLLTVNALAASDFIVIPCDSSKYALTGMSNLINKYYEIKEGCNPNLSILGILNTKVDGRYTTAKTSRLKLAEYFGDLLFNTYIPQNASVEKSQYEARPLHEYDKNSSAFQAYELFTKELIARVEV